MTPTITTCFMIVRQDKLDPEDRSFLLDGPPDGWRVFCTQHRRVAEERVADMRRQYGASFTYIVTEVEA